MTGNELLTGPEVARILKIGRTSAFELMASGRLPVVRVTPGGRGIRVHRDDLQAWVDAQRAEGRKAVEREQLITDIREAGRAYRRRA